MAKVHEIKHQAYSGEATTTFIWLGGDYVNVIVTNTQGVATKRSRFRYRKLFKGTFAEQCEGVRYNPFRWNRLNWKTLEGDPT